MLPKLPVLDSWISTGAPTSFVEEVLSLGKARCSAYVCFANVHMVVEAQHDASFRRVLEHAAIVAPDGSPVAAAVGWFNRGKRQTRVAGMDLLPQLGWLAAMAAASNTSRARAAGSSARCSAASDAARETVSMVPSTGSLTEA